MSDTATQNATLPEPPTFTPLEVEEFASDDVKAGSAIGIMLSALFLYTIVGMAISSWWTSSSIEADKKPAASDSSYLPAAEH